MTFHDMSDDDLIAEMDDDELEAYLDALENEFNERDLDGEDDDEF